MDLEPGFAPIQFGSRRNESGFGLSRNTSFTDTDRSLIYRESVMMQRRICCGVFVVYILATYENIYF